MDWISQQRSGRGENDGPGEASFRYRGPQPEILPPGAEPQNHGWYPPPGREYVPPPPQQRRRSAWAYAPATYVLVAINCAVFLAMALNHVSIWAPTTDQLVAWGADKGTLVIQDGQWWRLITSMFLHIGIIHIATNMWCLWNLGLLAEPLMGPTGVVGAYLLTGFAGNLLSVFVNPGMPGGRPGIVGAGASGAIFGLAGVLIVLLKSPLLPLPKAELKRLRRSVIYFSAINLGIGLYTAIGPSPIRIDNMAHLGGFLSGLALGVPLVPRIGAPRELFERRRLWGMAGMGFLLLLLAFGLRAFWKGAG